MALYKPGALIQSISGNVGSLNFVNSRYGPFIRKRLVRPFGASAPQLGRRARHAQIIEAWRTLTTDQVNSWKAAAALSTFPNRLGINRSLSGYQLFLKCNSALLLGSAISTDPPKNLIATPAPYDFIAYADDAPYIAAHWHQRDPPDAPDLVSIFGSRPHSNNPRSHFTNWRYLRYWLGNDPTETAEVTTQFNAIFGEPALGERIGLKIFPWNVDYLPGANAFASCEVIPD